jgi:hypothetical protein
MAVNFNEIHSQILEMGQQALLREKKLRILADGGRRILGEYGARGEELKELAARAAAANESLRCAVPLDEKLDQAFPPPVSAPAFVLLAADGSQASPSRHQAVEFGLINTGAIRMQPGQAVSPAEFTSSHLLNYEELFTSSGVISEEVLALRRDVLEREVLADLAEKETGPLVTLTDGTIELFREPKESAEFSSAFARYLKALNRLAERGAAAAGYVDKPRADLVVRLLELTLFDTDLDKAGRERPMGGVSDGELFTGLIPPGYRSAVFAIQSRTAREYRGPLGLHFFYLNVGSEARPRLARVEVPAWVVERPELLDLVHYALVGQARQMGARPYPYALHRAHEIAVVTLDDRDQLELMISVELARQGLRPGEKSAKQTAKDSAPRTRIGS